MAIKITTHSGILRSLRIGDGGHPISFTCWAHRRL